MISSPSRYFFFLSENSRMEGSGERERWVRKRVWYRFHVGLTLCLSKWLLDLKELPSEVFSFFQEGSRDVSHKAYSIWGIFMKKNIRLEIQIKYIMCQSIKWVILFFLYNKTLQILKTFEVMWQLTVNRAYSGFPTLGKRFSFPSGRGHLDFLFVALVQLSIKAPWPPSGASFIHFQPSGHLSFGSWVNGEKSRSHSLFEMLLVQHVDKTATRCCHPTPLSCLPEPALFSPLKNYITTTNPSNKLRLCFYGLQPKKTNSYQCPKLVRW